MEHDDPGWRPAFDGVIWFALPWVVLHKVSAPLPDGRIDVLVGVRRLYLAFAAMQVAVAVVVAVLAASIEGDLPVAIVSAAIGVWGALVLLWRRILFKPLVCESEATLVGSYKVTFLLAMATADAIPLAGFVGFILTGSVVPYLVGLALGLVGLIQSAPTRASLQRLQDDLSSNGCRLDLVQTLRNAPATR